MATVTLQLEHDDSQRLLRAALENAEHLYRCLAIDAAAKASAYATAGDASEARRNERRATECERRQNLVQLLLAQVPLKPARMPAPMGET